MKTSSTARRARRQPGQPGSRGFTLIELMITVAIIAILATIAYPSYHNYVLRGQLVNATDGLSAMRANMERYFQDNRTYVAINGFTPPCQNPPTTTIGTFTLTCTVTAATAPTANNPGTSSLFALTATGSGVTNGFVYTVNQADVQATTVPAGLSGWYSNTACWISKEGQTTC